MTTMNSGLSQATEEKLLEVFRNKPGIEKVILYGSRAMGNFKPGSDIDLSVLAPSLTVNDLLSMQMEIDDLLLPYKTDLSLLHLIDNPKVIEHIQRVGIDFFKREN